jgi:hypothetical protein
MTLFTIGEVCVWETARVCPPRCPEHRKAVDADGNR